jgi:DNA-binding SARP family transcriptional activator
MRYQLLGPLAVVKGAGNNAESVDLGLPKQQTLLAILLINRGTVVSTER